MELTSHAGGARALWNATLSDAAVGLAWLGQAGFAVRHAGHRLLIDPYHFLGFILKLGGLTLYHAGDCVVYDGQAERLRARKIDLALLPVNGRSDRLSARGIPGNMTFDEARKLCLAAGIEAMMPHHFGMFAFNTVEADELQRQAAQSAPGWHCVLPAADQFYRLTPVTDNSTPAPP